ncbi:hypothetical protein QF026_007335 [Streptomyces aurantiacus]|nr:hypothetical protein [Streptomyces aurantiacus]
MKRPLPGSHRTAWSPLDPYPGSGTLWRCLHKPCGKETSPTLSNLRRQGPFTQFEVHARVDGHLSAGGRRRRHLAGQQVLVPEDDHLPALTARPPGVLDSGGKGAGTDR